MRRASGALALAGVAALCVASLATPRGRVASEAPPAAAARNASAPAGAADDARKPSDVRGCLRSRWVVFVGDSVVRGIFFDLLDLATAAGTAGARAGAQHAGHAAEYTEGCLQTRRAGAFNRTRCAMWDYALCPPPAPDGVEAARRPPRLRVCVPGAGAPSCRDDARAAREPARDDTVAACGELRAPAPAAAACPGGAPAALRLTFFAKAYADEPCVDRPLLAALGAAARAPPSALVVGIGLWDMLYARPRSAGRFGEGVRALLAHLRAAGVRAPIAWLEVTAVAEAALPPFKRGRMSTAAAAELNALAAPALAADAGVRVVRLFAPTAAAPELSPDGVHYPSLAALPARTLGALCPPRRRG